MYAIVDQPALPLPECTGLEASPLLIVAYREIGAVMSRLASDGLQPSESNAWQHESVIERLLAERGVLPMRFGTLAVDEADARHALERSYAAFVATLERVRGRVELSVRVLWDDTQHASPASEEKEERKEELAPPRPGDGGRAYLLARLVQERRLKARRERAEGLAGVLHSHRARLADDSVQQVLASPRMLLTSAYLLEHHQLSAFQEAVRELSATYTSLRFLCTGPWPAYSFVMACSPAARGEDGEHDSL